MALAQDLAGLRGRADGEERRGAGPRGENARVPLCGVAGGLAQALAVQLKAASPARGWKASPLLLFSALLPPPLRPLQLCLAGPGFTRPQSQRGSAAADSILRPRRWGQDPSGSGPASCGSSLCLSSPKSPVPLWFCGPLRPAPRSALASLSPPSGPPSLPIPALPLASGLQPLLLLGSPTTRCQALPLSRCSVRFPPPKPLSSPVAFSPAQQPRRRHRRAFFQLVHPCGGDKEGLGVHLARRPLGN